MSRPIHVAILGATGYGAGELLRLFVQHAQVEVVSVTTTSRAGEPLVKAHPHLRGFYDLELTPTLDRERWLAAEYAVAISALPHGASGPAIAALLGDLEAGPGHAHVRLIDLSGDWRLQDAELHRRHYPDSPLSLDRRGRFVYGLPELFRERIRAARLVANPGCLANASILAAAPLVTPDFSGALAVDAKTGSSGSGRTLKDTTHHPTRHADHRAYRPLEHPHEPEILQALGDPAGQRVQVSFVPQSLDVARGIFVTVHATLPEPVRTCDLQRRYTEFYRDQPFIRVVDDSPRLQDVVGSNFCDVAVACRGRQVVVMAALDNLVKGMAGTAVQNMNLMCGLPETTGLWTPSFRPV